jgi:hypothetical protein
MDVCLETPTKTAFFSTGPAGMSPPLEPFCSQPFVRDPLPNVFRPVPLSAPGSDISVLRALVDGLPWPGAGGFAVGLELQNGDLVPEGGNAVCRPGVGSFQTA